MGVVTSTVSPVVSGTVLSTLLGAGFLPLSLFANDEAGVWYDPSDLSSLFQDAAGTTPVTAAGQPVGLMLDKSQGLVRGPELVTNGDFATDSDWTKGTNWTIDGGVITSDGSTSGAASALEQYDVFTAGSLYEVSFEISNYSSGNIKFSRHTTWTPNLAANGIYTYNMRATTDRASFRSDSAFTGDVDNVSVREITGNHATQATASKRPTYTEGSGLAWLAFDGVDDFLEFTQVISGTGPRSFIAATNQDDYGSVNNALFALQSSLDYRVGGDWTLLLEDDFAYLRVNGNSSFNYTGGTTPSAASVSSWRWSSARGASSSYTNVRLNAVELTLNGGSPQDINTVNTETSYIGSSPQQNNSFFAGKYFGMVLIGEDLSDASTRQAEAYLAAKSGVVL